MTATYFPADWVTFDGTFAYDNRTRTIATIVVEGLSDRRRSSVNTNLGNDGDRQRRRRSDERQRSARTFRKQFTSDLNGKLRRPRHVRPGRTERRPGATAQQFIVKDIFTLEQHQHEQDGDVERPDDQARRLRSSAATPTTRIATSSTATYPLRRQLAVRRRQPLGAVRPRVRRVARVRGAVLERPAHQRLPSPRVATERPATRRASTRSTRRTTAAPPAARSARPETRSSSRKRRRETELGRTSRCSTASASSSRTSTRRRRTRSSTCPRRRSLGFAKQWQNAGTLANTHVGSWRLNLPVINAPRLQLEHARHVGSHAHLHHASCSCLSTSRAAARVRARAASSSSRPTHRRQPDGFPQVNRYGNIWGRKFYKSCSDCRRRCRRSAATARRSRSTTRVGSCGSAHGNSWQDGITKNLWQTKLPAAQSPWNYPLYFGHPIVDRPLARRAGRRRRHATTSSATRCRSSA